MKSCKHSKIGEWPITCAYTLELHKSINLFKFTAECSQDELFALVLINFHFWKGRNEIDSMANLKRHPSKSLFFRLDFKLF